MTKRMHGEFDAPRSGGRIAAGRHQDGAGRGAGSIRQPAVEGATALSQPAERRRSPRLRVAPPTPVVVPRAPFIVLVLLVVVGGTLGILVLNTKINENAFRMQDLQATKAAQDLEDLAGVRPRGRVLAGGVRAPGRHHL